MSEMFISPSEMETAVPVEIRKGTVVRIVGLPHDLRPSEAARIARIVTAFAVPRPFEEEFLEEAAAMDEALR